MKDRLKLFLPRYTLRTVVAFGEINAILSLRIPEMWGPVLPFVSAGMYVIAAVSDYTSTLMAFNDPDIGDKFKEVNLTVSSKPKEAVKQILSKDRLIMELGFFGLSVLMPTAGISLSTVRIGTAIENFRVYASVRAEVENNRQLLI